jgi:hypothetical protein
MAMARASSRPASRTVSPARGPAAPTDGAARQTASWTAVPRAVGWSRRPRGPATVPAADRGVVCSTATTASAPAAGRPGRDPDRGPGRDTDRRMPPAGTADDPQRPERHQSPRRRRPDRVAVHRCCPGGRSVAAVTATASTWPRAVWERGRPAAAKSGEHRGAGVLDRQERLAHAGSASQADRPRCWRRHDDRPGAAGLSQN